MNRAIKINGNSHRADLGCLENYRITVKDGALSVSDNMVERTSDAEFEALFWGTERIEILSAPVVKRETAAPANAEYSAEPDLDPSPAIGESAVIDGYEIGPLLYDEGEDAQAVEVSRRQSIRKAEIYAALEELDRKLIRPLAEGESGRIAEIVSEKRALRAELAEIEECLQSRC